MAGSQGKRNRGHRKQKPRKEKQETEIYQNKYKQSYGRTEQLKQETVPNWNI